MCEVMSVQSVLVCNLVIANGTNFFGPFDRQNSRFTWAGLNMIAPGFDFFVDVDATKLSIGVN